MRRFFSRSAPLPVAVSLLFTAFQLAAAGCGGAAADSGDRAGSAESLLPATVDSRVLGILNGEELTLDALPDQDRWQLAQLKNEYYTEVHRLLERGAIRAARERLLTQAADAEGLTLNQYYTRVIGLPEVSNEELQQVYEQNRGQFGGRPLEEIAVDLRRQIANQKLNRNIEFAGEQFLSEAEWDLTVPAYRVEIDTAGHASIGPEDAPVELVVFSDFECPYCRRFNEAVDRMRETEELAEQVRLVFRHYPLRSIHPRAQKASEAALCAGDQGSFWEFHDALWADEDLSPDTLEQHARLIGLDTDEFDACLNSGRHYEQVQADLEAAMGFGQTGTPAVFSNGRYIGGAISFQQLQAEIERELAELE